MGRTNTAGIQQPQTERSLLVSMGHMEPVSWAAWRQALGRLGGSSYERNRAIKTTSPATWRAYYDRCYSPEIALLDVMTEGGWASLLSK